jgi:hypothetical protein
MQKVSKRAHQSNLAAVVVSSFPEWRRENVTPKSVSKTPGCKVESAVNGSERYLRGDDVGQAKNKFPAHSSKPAFA